MKKCNKINCINEIPTFLIVDGKRRNLQNRNFCLTCSPFKSHNTVDLNAPPSTNTSYTHVKSFRKRKKQKAVDYKGGKCQICGYNRCNESLTFHHLDPKLKDFSIANSRSWGFDRIKSELDKCVLLCSNCHSEVHQGLITVEKLFQL